MKTMNIFATVKILFEFILYFVEYGNFKLDILVARTPCSKLAAKTLIF